MRTYGFNERECPVCGKRFIMAESHIYKKIFKYKTLTFCGWNCMRKFENDNSCIRKLVK